MDEQSVMWKQSRYDEIKDKLIPFLHKSGYEDKDLYWIPISGLTGSNIIKKAEKDCKWYNGPSLVEIIDDLKIENRDSEKPLRIPVLDRMKD